MLVGVSESGGVRNFPGSVDAGQRADLSFRVDGKLIELPVKEGDDVKQDQVLAKLDPKDFQIVVNDKAASFSRAKADYTRAKKLVGPGHISRMDYDRIEADYKSRLADLNKAKQQLNYTVLKAPFAGTIAKRYYQNHEEVILNEHVFALRNNALLEVKINVPENIMQQILTDREVPVSASFDAFPGKSFPLTFKEISTKADTKTKTFLTTFTMPAPKSLNILPGMTATVSADLSRELSGDTPDIFYLPVSAVTGDAKLESRIWVVDETTMTVHPLSVKLGMMQANQVEVLDGLSGQERVVIAGAGYMADGMKVLLMHQPEQADPRPEDVRLSIGTPEKGAK
ncbi:MAG: efflux RND transporter periplasmic adaptor subunit [Methyloprofundus sp.]|nr:efflux RND transporter periplasmic adaptor subunit [Methyloprofundus sp.]